MDYFLDEIKKGFGKRRDEFEYIIDSNTIIAYTLAKILHNFVYYPVTIQRLNKNIYGYYLVEKEESSFVNVFLFSNKFRLKFLVNRKFFFLFLKS